MRGVHAAEATSGQRRVSYYIIIILYVALLLLLFFPLLFSGGFFSFPHTVLHPPTADATSPKQFAFAAKARRAAWAGVTRHYTPNNILIRFGG